MDGAVFCVRVCFRVVCRAGCSIFFDAAADGYMAERDTVVYRIGGRADDTVFVVHRRGVVDDGAGGVVACVGVFFTGIAQ